MGEYRQPGGGNIERSGLECEAASSECGETLYRFSSVQTCPAAAARASAHSSALCVEPLSPKMDQSKLKLAIALRESVEEYNAAIKEFREIFGR